MIPWDPADRLQACITEGWRIAHDPLVRVADLDHAFCLVCAAAQAYNATLPEDSLWWEEWEDVLLAESRHLGTTLLAFVDELTGEDCVW